MSGHNGTGKGRPLLPQALCGLALCFTMFVFGPVEMVTLNSVNFWFGVGDFLPVFLVLFAAVFCVIEAVYCLLRKLPYPLWLLSLALLFGGTLCVYVQGTYLCLGGEALVSGDPVWREMLPQMLVNLAVWAAIMLGSMALSLTKPKVFLKVVPAACALILVMEGAALTTLLLQKSERGDLSRIYCSDEEQFTFSPNGDAIVIMLDTFDTRLMDQALEEDPDYADVFEDFTYYRNTSSSTMLTDTSYTSFVTGQVADNTEPFFIYCRRAMRESRFFATMKDAGLRVQVYGAPYGVYGEEQIGQVDNLRVRDSEIKSYTGFVKEMLCMIGYRYLPTAMQPFLLRDYVNGFASLQRFKGLGYQESSGNNLRFLEKMRADGVTVDADKRFFKLYNLHGAHKPTQFNRYMEPAENVPQYEELLGCFAMLDEWFVQMKEAGVYDKATIIVMGDHGINDDWRRGICNPAMMVKYPGETGPMRTSMAPTTLLDMRATALYGAGIPYDELGTPAHLWEGTAQRERTLRQYIYDVPYSFGFYLNDMTEYIVPEDATDLDAYVPSGRVFKAAK